MYYLVYYFHGTWKLCPECREEEVTRLDAWELANQHLKAGHPVKIVPCGKRCGSRR